MVSIRPRSRYFFEKGEKVLCYEPDPTKTKVLYDSKILGTYETKDKRGRKLLQYKVHFFGWSSTWDRKVNADFVLKDTEENRQLQRDLADKAQLQLDAYLYRKDRGSSSGSNRKRSRKSTVVPTSTLEEGDTSGVVVDTSAPDHSTTSPPRSEDNFSSSSTTFEKHEDFPMRDECETESYCSSVESFHDEERVMLRISERLRHYLEYDHDMTVKYGKQHTLPSRIPVIAILENFVKQSAVKLVFSTTQTENTRRRTTQQRNDKKEREFDKLVATVGLLKEVADGLRIYFDFTITDYLLYKEEKDYAMSYLSEENLKNFTYVASSSGLSPDILNPKCEGSEQHTLGVGSSVPDGGAEMHYTEATTTPTSEEPQKRKLRSHRSEADDCDLMLENCLSSIASTSSGASTPLHSNVMASSNVNYLKSLQPMALSIPPQTKDFLQAVLSWRLLPSNAAPVASMIFGAAHLARLIVKLPEFLNASSLNDDKLKVLLQHLDSFTNYLEAHKEWFNEDNYARPASKTATPSESAKTSNPELEPQQQQQKSQPSQAQPNEEVTTIATTTTTTTTPTTSSTIAT